MDARKLSNFMVIKSFSDNEKSLLDCLMPFVEYGLAKYRQEYIQVTDLKSYIKKECLIDIPLNTIKTLLKRLKKEGRITDYENCTIIRCVDNYVRKSNQYEESMMTFSRQTNQLVERCREYCSFDMDMDKVSMLIYEFIKSYQLILDIYNGNTDGNPSEESNPEYKKLVLYVKYIAEYDNESYTTFKNIFYGCILEQFVSSGNDYDKKNFGKCNIYVDTDYVLRVLDWQAPFFTEASQELLKLLHDCGFAVIVLPEILEEVRAVLAAYNIRYAKEKETLINLYGKETAQLDGIMGAFFRRNMTTISIDEYIDQLEEEVQKIGIVIDYTGIPNSLKISQREFDIITEYKKKSAHYEQINDLDQKAYVEDIIAQKAELDAKLLGFIRHKRAKKRIFRFQDARYILLSCDKAICKASARMHQRDNSIPESYTESSLTSALFICNPIYAGEVPIKLLLSIFQMSDFIDYTVLSQFHKDVSTYIDSNPNDQKYLTYVFKNQHLFAEINANYSFEGETPVCETALIDRLFKEAEGKYIQSNDEKESLAAENVALKEELERLKNDKRVEISPDTQRAEILQEKETATPMEENKKNDKAERILNLLVIVVLLIAGGIAVWFGITHSDFRSYALTSKWWLNCWLSFSPFIFIAALASKGHDVKTMDDIINYCIYDDRSKPIIGILLTPSIKAALWLVASGVVPAVLAVLA